MKDVVIEKDYKIKIKSTIKDFSFPEKIYIPILNHYKLNAKNQKVYKEDIILYDGNKPIYSYVSGEIVGYGNFTAYKKELEKFLIIKNDLKEEINNFNYKPIVKTKESFLKLLEEKNIVAYNNDKDIFKLLKNAKRDDILLISCIEDEPYLVYNNAIIKYHIDEVLNMIDEIISLFNLQAMIVLISSDSENIKKVLSRVGRYPNISLKLVKDYYGYNNDLFLKNKLSITKKIIRLDVGDILNIYYLYKRGKIFTKKYITLTGNCLKNRQNIKVKIGINFNEILPTLKLSNQKCYGIVNGLMKGKAISLDNLIITQDIKGIVFTDITEEKEEECINCGLCYKVCPQNIDPRNANKNKECLKCNLCSYVCPAKINLNTKGGK